MSLEGTTKPDQSILLEWFMFVKALRAKKGDRAFSDLQIYHLLLKTHSAQEVTTLLETAKTTPGLKKIATSVQKSLSGEWISKALRKTLTPWTFTIHFKS
ncbi:hypothetical protein F441_22878 [Phytophthora nicotianae CJ01A1]|uniref:RXLR phytopathogen effector protein WY-domain domain-containing protein n=6 Tax=Phytophthora nicotianae TaxID=4792 RepID=W2RJQ2_PHYN3|nr:hypothetical protein PPTG_01033 [Phytophthora nicotianae INRA-310]ETK95988.1 hypothetical protein L915_01151 [Phytophthora nicotianae]ETO84918.1 hypothetical protein F444_01220 [Phytophthora nicotianae P1976]ETO99698.1 hypothetical protein F441_22878 [Phytophthora nicotianae CJ01A1]ETP53995.1 hypothetical protein F442_01155 [Phytophthora nicotianae P10297]ETL49366.1 hypothetical protein L916_01133 [Phytophthora nicotianae]